MVSVSGLLAQAGQRAALYHEASGWRPPYELKMFSAFDRFRSAHPLSAEHAVSPIVKVGPVCGAAQTRAGAVYGMGKAALHQLPHDLARE